MDGQLERLVAPGVMFDKDTCFAVHFHPFPSSIRIGAAGVWFRQNEHRVWPVDVVLSGRVVDALVDQHGVWTPEGDKEVDEDFFQKVWDDVYTYLIAIPERPPSDTRLGFLLDVWEVAKKVGDRIHMGYLRGNTPLQCGTRWDAPVVTGNTPEAPPLHKTMASADITATPVEADKRAVYALAPRHGGDPGDFEMVHVWPIVESDGVPGLYVSMYCARSVDESMRLVAMDYIIEPTQRRDIGVDSEGRWQAGRINNGRAANGRALFDTVLGAFSVHLRVPRVLILADVVRADVLGERESLRDNRFFVDIDIENPDIDFGWHSLGWSD